MATKKKSRSPATKRATSRPKRTKRKTVKKIVNKTTKNTVKKPRVSRSGITKKAEARMKAKVLEDQGRFFYLKNGRKMKSPWDLIKNLERMSEEVYSFHVTPYKNDFSAWLYHEFGEVELARQLANEKSKKKTIELIKEYYK